MEPKSRKIWHIEPTLEVLNATKAKTLLELLGIEFTEVGDDYVKGSMPVDSRTHQPAGILHGGASVALAESLASTAGSFVVDRKQFRCVGLEINANHISSCQQGFVEGVSRPLHLGRSTQIWETKIYQGERLVCVSRMTLAVLRI